MSAGHLAKVSTTEIALTVAFAMTGAHALFVGWGVDLGAAWGIEPLFEGAHSHAGHAHGGGELLAANDSSALPEPGSCPPGVEGHWHGDAWACDTHDGIDEPLTFIR